MNQRDLMAGFVLASTAIAGACSGDRGGAGDAGEGERAGGIAVVCTAALPDALDPLVSGDIGAADLRLLLYTPLVLYDSAGGVRPYLAREWEWQDNQRRLILHLRTDVSWHDGQPVSAEDVAWTLLAAADSSYAYPAWGDVSAIRDVVVRDPATVEVLFDAPFIAGLEPFVQLPILPRHLVGEIPVSDFAHADYQRAPIGSGPFRFNGRTADGSLQFDRFDGFPSELGTPLLDRIVLRAVPEPSAMMIELQTGSIDACVTGASFARQVSGTPGLEAKELAPSGVQVVELSTRTPPLDDARVRRAVSAALRRSEVAAAVSPLARPARTWLPSGSERWGDTGLLQPDADTALAAALLDSAGWRRGTDGMRRDAGGAPLRFTIVAPQPLETVLTVVQGQLRAAGIDAQLRFMEGSAFLAMLRNPRGRPAAIAVSLFPEKFMFPDPSSQLHSEGGVNLTGWGGPATDSIIERLGTVLTDDERATAYHELQRRVAEEVPILYTVYFPRTMAVGERLRDVEVDLNGPFAHVTEWWIPAAQRRRGAAGAGARTPAESAGS